MIKNWTKRLKTIQIKDISDLNGIMDNHKPENIHNF